ncbi:hypothetical protein XIS1_1700115 [Xenorhabdus innexi]|uniref:Uncharacterized protein n=1 Tax=Xenorhabdus innexi TaxID=290109 RepID=A0A1N6MWB0_9GAMM|nr:hypothetical protein XIS1_1700115 [Xenorhabdus innexi]
MTKLILKLSTKLPDLVHLIKRKIYIILLLQFYSPPIYCVSGRFTATSSQQDFSHLGALCCQRTGRTILGEIRKRRCISS